MDFSFKAAAGVPAPVKYSLISLGALGLVAGILCALIIPPTVERIQKCETIGAVVDGQCTVKNLAFVVGDTKNTPAPQINFPDYISVISEKNKNISKLSVAKSSSTPTKVSANAENRIKKEISNMVAEADGADYLEAIRSAASSFDNKDESVIYVIGSGLSDKGLLNFADNDYIDSNISANKLADTIASKFSKNAYRELAGVKIIWDGLGATAYNDKSQTPLSQDQKDQLKSIYAAILAKLGATDVTFKQTLSGDDSTKTAHTVKPTKISEEIINITETFSASTTNQFQFVADSATLTDETATKNKVTELVQELKSHPNAKATIDIYHADASCSGIIDYSLLSRRQEAIISLFRQANIEDSRLVAGQQGLGPVNDCANGYFQESEGAKNRIVAITISNKNS